MARRQQPAPRARFRHFQDIQTRWNDNDPYGHVNNAVYYQYFDSLVNAYLIAAGALDIGESDAIGLVAQTGCSYFAPLVFPDNIAAGLAVTRLGTSSVTYEIGLFASGEGLSAARGFFVHVYVDRATRRPVPVPAAVAAAARELVIADDKEGEAL